jgi:hypothetical protein
MISLDGFGEDQSVHSLDVPARPHKPMPASSLPSIDGIVSGTLQAEEQ